jgi:transcription antitermination factor NusA-like protein
MVGTIDMQNMRYLNLFNKICNVQTKYCFKYNNALVFVVPNQKVSLAIGPGARNAKLLSAKLSHKVKVVGINPASEKDSIKKLITTIADPVTLTKLELKDSEVIITGGRQAKASLIGRNRAREKELLNILKGLFGIKSIRFN